MVGIGLMPDSIVAYLMKAFGQDVLQVSTDKLRAFYPGCQPSAAFTVLVAECYMALVHADNPMIGDGNAKYISTLQTLIN